MGRIEKLVVLTVLFAAAVVVAVNLTGNGEARPNDAETPIEKARADLLERAGRAAEKAASLSSAAGEPPAAPLLSSTVTPTAAVAGSETPGAATAPGGRPAAVDRSALRPSTVPDLWLYDWRAGDTWSAVAARIYGDASYESVLRGANDGGAAPAPGTPVVVPMFDPAPGGALAASRPTPPSSGAAAPSAAPAAAPSPSGPRVHVVQPGDTLSSIAVQYYGSAARWRDLANANREVVPNPDRLSVGARLRVP